MKRYLPLLGIPALVAAAPRFSHAADFFAPTKVHELTLHLTLADWNSLAPTRNQPSAPGGMGLEFPEIKSKVTVDGKDYEVGLRFKGNSSYMSSSRSAKRPFKIDFNQYVKGQSHDGQTKLNLNNNFSDQTQIRETLAYEVFRRMGIASPRTTLARVVVKLDGEDKVLGLYTLAEQVDTHFLKDRFGTSEGLLLKPEGARGGIVNLGDDWKRYEQLYDPKGKPSAEEKARFIAFTKLVTGADEATFKAEIGKYLDIEAFATFMAATVVTSNGDSILSMGHNFYIWHNPKTGKYQFLPWDLNMAFGGFPIGDAVHLSVKKPYSGQLALLDRVFPLPEFQAAYRKACRQGAKILTELDSLHDSTAAAAKPIAAQDYKDTNNQGGPGGPGGPGGGRGPGGPGGMGGTRDLKAFFSQRAASVLAQLDGKEAGVTPQGGFGPGGGGPGGPGGPDMASMLGGVFLQLTGAGDTPTLAVFTEAWKKGAAFCDKNKDGKLTQEEFVGGMSEVLGGGFGPAQFLGPQLWKALNVKDGVTTATLAGTIALWGTLWDLNKDGKLSATEIGNGLTKVLAPPDFGGGF